MEERDTISTHKTVKPSLLFYRYHTNMIAKMYRDHCMTNDIPPYIASQDICTLFAIWFGSEIVDFIEFILDMGSAIVTSSLVGWAHT